MAYFFLHIYTRSSRVRCGYFSDINCQIFVFPENIADFRENQRKPRYSLRAFLFTLENSVHFTRFWEARKFLESMRFWEAKVRAWAWIQAHANGESCLAAMKIHLYKRGISLDFSDHLRVFPSSTTSNLLELICYLKWPVIWGSSEALCFWQLLLNIVGYFLFFCLVFSDWRALPISL